MRGRCPSRAASWAAVAALGAVQWQCEAAIEATHLTFSERLRATDLALVRFHAPWCGHSKKLHPEWEHAQQLLTERQAAVAFIDVDVAAQPQLATQQGAESLPTIKVYRGGSTTGFLYTGPRTASALVEFVETQMQPAVRSVQSEAGLLEAAGFARATAVYYGDGPDAPGRQAFLGAAVSARLEAGEAEAVVWVTAPGALAAADGVTPPAVTVRVEEDDDPASGPGGARPQRVEVYEGPWESAALRQWVQVAAPPLLARADAEEYASAAQRGLPLGWLLVDEADALQAASAKRAARAAVSSFRGRLTALWADVHEFGQLGPHLGLTLQQWPAFAVEHNSTRWAFDQGRELTGGSLQRWLQDWADGRLQPTLRSERAPASPTKWGMTTLVGTTIRQLAWDKAHDVLLLVHAPWCGYCQAMVPDFDEVARKLEPERWVRVARIDGTKNDLPAELEVRSYPTVVLIQSRTNNVIYYDGDRSATSLMSFVQRNARGSISGGAWVGTAKDDEL
eukprot:TRINITY_DN21798_c0_g1_i1.p1 TRINITY_DN21798_c0_g1~~TRINITY_DN21798_c0_g1_i1.p1  ORF type:complete len:534 (+),score=166.37 TRINITY_DN21798_c0_g1_i1:80-1603(+)